MGTVRTHGQLGECPFDALCVAVIDYERAYASACRLWVTPGRPVFTEDVVQANCTCMILEQQFSDPLVNKLYKADFTDVAEYEKNQKTKV